MGWKNQPTRLVSLTDVKVHKKNLIGEEGNGFKIAMQGLDGGRINIATCSIGTAVPIEQVAIFILPPSRPCIAILKPLPSSPIRFFLWTFTSVKETNLVG